MKDIRALPTANHRKPAPWRMPVALWCAVMAVALMSFYVHLLNTQVLRGEKLRQAQRASTARPALQVGPSYQPVNALVALHSRPVRLAGTATVRQ